MDREEIVRAVEAILFVSGEPVPMDAFKQVFDHLEESELLGALNELMERSKGNVLEVVEIAEGWQFRTVPEVAEWIKKFHKLERSTRLSPAALEVLSIIAYKQPATRQEIEDIRGVDSSSIVKKLMDKGLIRSMGHKRVAGKPMTFGTTKKFLEYFGLSKLSDMPTLKDFSSEFANVDAQKELDFDEVEGKTEEDLQLEREAAMVEPLPEDYEDDDIENELPPEEPEEELEAAEACEDGDGDTENR